jgi:hypothetical protein
MAFPPAFCSKDQNLTDRRASHDAGEYESQIKAKFPEGWYDRLADAFDGYLKGRDPDDLNRGSMLFDLYKAWRDGNKVGFNRVDLEKPLVWLHDSSSKARG